MVSERRNFTFSNPDRVLLEAIPNLSTDSAELVEATRQCLQDSLVAQNSDQTAALDAGFQPAALLDVHFDIDHARSVWTLAGNPPGLIRVLIRLAESVLKDIDLRAHRGEHPRMGAIDVVPIVPLSEGDDAGRWALWAARQFAEDLWFRFRIPSYFYGRAATRPDRVALPETRKPFEELQVAIADGWLPDTGDPVVHERWGATAVGVRGPLVAFNVVLETEDLEPARRIASELRRMRKEGRLPGVMALPFSLKSRGLSQVSMNLTEPEAAGVEAAFSAVLSLADREGVGVGGAEVVGLAPQVALEGCSRKLLELCPDLVGRSLEDRLRLSALPLEGTGPWFSLRGRD
jgi:glutamate formiminotransferase